MKTVLVTGGTGFLGEHVVTCLHEAGGYAVRALARGRSPVLDALAIDTVALDLGDQGDDGDALVRALEGCAGVFHLAGVVSRSPDDSQRMMRLHIDGTRRVYEAAKRAGVSRVVVASTSGTVAVSKDNDVMSEDDGYATEVVAGWPYYASKIYQEKLAFELGERLGIETVVVNPSLLLGPGDRRLSSTGDVLRFLRRQIPVVPEGGMNFVDVRDAAAATVAAMERGRPGERYLLGGPNWSVGEFFGRLERVAKVKGPSLRAPGGLSRMSAGLIEHLYRSRGKEPPVDRISVEMGQHYWYIDSSKAARELGFTSRDPSLTLVDTVNYLRRDIADDI